MIINVLLLLMAVAVCVLARNRNLFAVVILSGAYSFLMATVLVAMDALDVAMTEASVGAGMSMVLFLSALFLGKSEETRPLHRPWLPLSVALAVGDCWSTARWDCRGFRTRTPRFTSTSCRAI